MPDRAALYLRVSSDEQRKDNLSIANQLTQCLEYVQRKGYVLADVGRYVDAEGNDAPSGTPAFAEDASARVVTTPVLLELLSAARSGAFDVMVALDVTRVSRGEPFLLGALRGKLKDYGVRLEYARMTTGDKRTDTVMESMHALASYFESGDKAYRTRNGKRQSAEVRQRHSGPPPFGYMTVHDKDHPAYAMLQLDPERAPIARSIFDSYLHGASLRQIARELTLAQVPPPRASRKDGSAWASQTLGRLLKNTVYRGLYVFGIHERIGKKLVRADRSKRLEIPCPAIVSDDEWYAVQNRLAVAALMVRNHPTTRTYALRGRIFCADCGRSYIGQWNGRDQRLEYRHRRRDGGCRHHAVGGKIEREVYEAISQLQLDPERARRQYDKALKQHLDQFGHIDELLEDAKAERLKQDRALDKLTASYLDPDIGMTKTRFLALSDAIAKKVDALDHQIFELDKQRAKSPLPAHLESFETFYTRLRAVLAPQDLTPEEAEGIVETIPVAGLPVPSSKDKQDFLLRLQERRVTPQRLAKLYEDLNVRVEVGPGQKPKVTIMGQSATSRWRCGQLPVGLELPLAA